MPTPTNYTYSIPSDCPGAAINPGKLHLAIQGSSIVTALDRISTTGGTATNGQVTGTGSLLTIYFKDVLSTADRTTLDSNNGSGGVNTGAASATHPAGGLISTADNTQSPIISGEGGFRALGFFAGMVPSAAGRGYGYLGTSSVNSVPIRATAYTPPGNNVGRSIKSSSALDTSAGTGAQKVTITYFDAACTGPFTETVTLNGTTAVNTVSTTIALIERMDVVQVGSTGGNQGTITLLTGTGGAGTTIGTIAAQDNLTYWAHHYVPASKTCYITYLTGSASVTNGGITIQVVNPIDSTKPQYSPDITFRHGTSELTPRDYATPIPISGPALIWLNEKPDAATVSTLYGTFHWTQF